MRVVRELVDVHTLWRAPSTPPTPGGPQGGRQTDATCSHAAAGTSEQQHTPCASAADAPAAAAAESVQQLCSLFRKPQTLACRSRGRLSTNRELIREPAGGERGRGNNARLQHPTTQAPCVNLCRALSQSSCLRGQRALRGNRGLGLGVRQQPIRQKGGQC